MSGKKNIKRRRLNISNESFDIDSKDISMLPLIRQTKSIFPVCSLCDSVLNIIHGGCDDCINDPMRPKGELKLIRY